MGLVAGDADWRARVVPVVRVDCIELEVPVSVDLQIDVEGEGGRAVIGESEVGAEGQPVHVLVV